MTLGFLSEIDIITLGLAFGVSLLSGIVKGAVGFGMPLVIVSGLSTFLDPKIAIAGIIFPIVVSNLLQTFRTGLAPAIDGLRFAWRYVLVVCVAIFVAAQLVPSIPNKLFFFVIGLPVLVLSLIQLLGVHLHISARHRGWSEWVVGLVAGAVGGLAGTWGAPTVLYLLAIETPKMKQIVVQGIVYGVGSVTLLFAHLRSGILNSDTIPFSLSLLAPALIGMWIGFQIQDKLDQARFRKVTLIVLLFAAANLIRKGVVS